MKQKVLSEIYAIFSQWSEQHRFACRKGCSVCCTQNIQITELEAQRIISFIREQSRQAWLQEKLAHRLPPAGQLRTANEWAEACLKGLDIDPGGGSFTGICPFLEDDCCSIYEVRPFGCRCFVSLQTCQAGQQALLPTAYLSGATAFTQLIEHLGQGGLWGGMLHLLAALTSRKPDGWPPPSCRIAKPLPGFLIPEEDYPEIAPLLHKLFDRKVNGRRIESILNKG